ncbi:MAG: sulfur carrier protein ThiS [Bryobacteraceae bacterium]|nr:sulfur carrier protein ThiS [Bryobacteraceae bacterium]
MEIVLNGEKHQAPQGCTVLELLQSLGIDPARVAVELDGAIARRTAWADTRLAAGARVEVVHFVGGG